MFNVCRPVVRKCVHGHVVGVEEQECEEGHRVHLDQDLDQSQQGGIFSQVLSVIR